MAEDLAFSVIIPVFHGGAALRNVLASMRELDFPANGFEVLVAVPEGDEATLALIDEEAASCDFALACVACPTSERPALLNAASARARGNILAFTDEHCTVSPGWLSSLNAALSGDAKLGMAGGPDQLAYSNRWLGKGLSWVMNSFAGTGGCRSNRGLRAGRFYPRPCNMAVRRSVATDVAYEARGDRVRIFDESLPVHENIDLTERIEGAGWRVVHVPDMHVTNFRDTQFLSFVSRNFQMARVARKMGVHRLPHTTMSATILAVLALAVLATVYPHARIALGATALAYATMLIGCALLALLRTGKASVLLTVPLLLAVLHFARGFGYIAPAPPTASSNAAPR
jgi:cellulose synthase/poly-beta-1,6-N-acetylglucosamine synthase-like glycosyltransferase